MAIVITIFFNSGREESSGYSSVIVVRKDFSKLVAIAAPILSGSEILKLHDVPLPGKRPTIIALAVSFLAMVSGGEKSQLPGAWPEA